MGTERKHSAAVYASGAMLGVAVLLPSGLLALKLGSEAILRNELAQTSCYGPFIPDARLFRLLLRLGADVNTRTTDGTTALTMATEADQISLMKHLIQSGADVNHRTVSGSTAVMSVRSRGALELLCANGADLDARDEAGRTVLHCTDSAEVMAGLLVRRLSLDRQDARGRTALMEHVICGRIDQVTLLLRNGADVHLRDVKGETARGIVERLLRESRPRLRAYLSSSGHIGETISILRVHEAIRSGSHGPATGGQGQIRRAKLRQPSLSSTASG